MARPDQTVEATLSEEQVELLCRAFREWNDASFTDQDVEGVKAIFQEVFGTQVALKGFPIDDALVMQAPSDKTTLYCMVVRPGFLEWVRLEFKVRNFEFLCLPRFELLRLVAMEYNDDPRDRDEDSGPCEE